MNGVEQRLNALTIFFFGYLALVVFDGWLGTYPENIIEIGLGMYMYHVVTPAMGGIVFGWALYSFCGLQHSFESVVYLPLLIFFVILMLSFGSFWALLLSSYFYFMWGQFIYLAASSKITL